MQEQLEGHCNALHLNARTHARART